MPVPLTALFASALYQVRAATGDAAAMDRAISLLARAAGETPITLEIIDGRFLVNDMPVPTDAPGAALVMASMLGHDTARLSLPGCLHPKHWRDVAEIYASASGLFPTPGHLIEALQAAVPLAEVVSAGRHGPVIDSGTGASAIDAKRPPGETFGLSELSSVKDDRAEFSAQLDPLLAEGREAAERHEYERLASVMLELHDLEAMLDDAQRSIVLRERRRMVSREDLNTMVRLLPKSDSSVLLARAIASTGADGIEAFIEVLNGAEGRPERRNYIDALVEARHADRAILKALTSHRPDLVAAVAEVAGRRRMEKAVPQLAHLLKHGEETVRTSAWRSLEQIGTAEAFAALHGRA
jgi:hypothetical protein